MRGATVFLESCPIYPRERCNYDFECGNTDINWYLPYFQFFAWNGMRYSSCLVLNAYQPSSFKICNNALLIFAVIIEIFPVHFTKILLGISCSFTIALEKISTLVYMNQQFLLACYLYISFIVSNKSNLISGFLKILWI